MPLKRILLSINWRNFLIRTLIVLVIGSTLYGTYLFINRAKQSHQKNAISQNTVRTSLTEHLLALNALRRLDTASPSAVYQVGNLRKNVAITLDNYKNNFQQYSKDHHDLNETNMLDFTEVEQQLFSIFDKNYRQLGKSLEYTLSQDIGFINPSSDRQEITTRTNISAEKLMAVSKSNFLSDKTRSSFEESIKCIKEVGNNPPNDQATLLGSIKQCDNLYQNTKTLALQDLLKIFNDKNSQQFFDNIKQLINSFTP